MVGGLNRKLLIGQFCGSVVLLEHGCKINEAIKSRENRDILEKLSLQGNNLQGEGREYSVRGFEFKKERK